MRGSKFLGKQPTTGSDTVEVTKIGIDEPNVHSQTGTDGTGNKEANNQTYQPKGTKISNKFVSIHLF